MASLMCSITGTLILISGVLLPSVTVLNATTTAHDLAIERAARRVTIPAGTVLRLRMNRGFGSDISRVEDPVSATLARGVVVGGRTVLPAGSLASGYVVEATRPGKVKGRGRVGVRFTRITPADESVHYDIRTQSWVAVAPATKKKDALTIALPAAGGAGVGALIDGKKGAAIGAAVGGGAGTAAVLTTRGKDVRIGRGATLSVRLAAPLTIAVE
jgi:hypothetical protein